MQFLRFEDGRGQPAEGAVVREEAVRIHLNGREFARLMCTPEGLEELTLGFLRSEEIIRSREDVRLLVVNPNSTCVDVWLRNGDRERATVPVITSGCGGGVTFAELTAVGEPVRSELRVRPAQLARLMSELLAGRSGRGLHRSALAFPDGLLMVVEDVGRHNTIDKLWGRCLIQGRAMEDCILLSTGRISSDMLTKAARMRVPVVVSRTSPTTLAVALARAWNVTVVGYVRQSSMNVYSGAERILEDEEERADANVQGNMGCAQS